MSMDAKVLRRAAELIDQGHCKSALARTVEGGMIVAPVVPDRKSGFSDYRAIVCHPEAAQWCMGGAVLRASYEHDVDGFSLWQHHVDVAWNNAAGRTADEVAAALRAAADRCDATERSEAP